MSPSAFQPDSEISRKRHECKVKVKPKQTASLSDVRQFKLLDPDKLAGEFYPKLRHIWIHIS